MNKELVARATGCSKNVADFYFCVDIHIFRNLMGKKYNLAPTHNSHRMLKIIPRVFLAFLFAAGAVGVSLAISSRVLVNGVQDEDRERNAKLESTASSTTSVPTSEDEAPPDLRDVRLQRMEAAFSKIKDRLPEADRVVLQCLVSGRGNPRPLFGVRVLEFLASQQATPDEVEENWLKPDEELLWRAVLPLDEETVELITTQERFAGNVSKVKMSGSGNL